MFRLLRRRRRLSSLFLALPASTFSLVLVYIVLLFFFFSSFFNVCYRSRISSSWSSSSSSLSFVLLVFPHYFLHERSTFLTRINWRWRSSRVDSRLDYPNECVVHFQNQFYWRTRRNRWSLYVSPSRVNPSYYLNLENFALSNFNFMKYYTRRYTTSFVNR